MNRASGTLLWIAVALLGAFAFGTIALAHGERISALWIVIAAVCERWPRKFGQSGKWNARGLSQR